MTLQSIRKWLFWILPALLLVWWRGHTFGPVVLQSTGIRLWPVVSGRSEPLDCDEAAYGYMARRQVAGAVLYKDLTEYKPPGGYWFYALAVAAGGASEMTVRLMVMPVIVLNLWLVGLMLLKIANRTAALAGMLLFLLLSTDPYVYGNGSNLEHLMNFGLTFSVLAAIESFRSSQKSRWLLACGTAVGLAATVKQVCLLGLGPIGLYLILQMQPMRIKIRDVALLAIGFAIPWLLAIGILAGQGALLEAWADVVEYSRALAANTPPDANAPPSFYRWLTGNADPRNGRLPWPFGRTDWLVWWGTGGWPAYILAVAATVWSLKGKATSNRNEIRLIAFAWLAAWAMIVLPGLYWQHYYMLLAPGAALLGGLVLGRAVEQWQGSGKIQQKLQAAACLGLIIASLFATCGIQIKDYLLVPAEQITSKYKGGAQWVSLRLLSEEIEKRVSGWSPRPRMEMWGWQSPVLFYADLDAPSAYFFTDPLMKAFALKGHPMIEPRLRQLTADLAKNPPELILCGDEPFPALKAMIDRNYLASKLLPSAPDGRGLHVRKDLYQQFHDPAFSVPKSGL